MRLCELMTAMEQLSPPTLAEEWDNVGLMCGDGAQEIDTVVVALDVTKEAVAFAKEQGAGLIVSHHPLIFSPVHSVTAPGVLYDLCRSGIAAFAAHTNLDKAQGGVNDTLAACLGLDNVAPAFDGLGRVGTLRAPMSPKTFAAMVGQTLETHVQLRAGDRNITTVALVSGSGGDFIAEVSADAFVTGEVKHHEWLGASETLTVVCAGHYATEVVVVDTLCRYLSEHCPSVTVIPFVGNAPYQTI